MFEQLNMTKKLKRQISKAVSIALSAAMLVTGLPAEVTGGVTSVKAAAVVKDGYQVTKDADWTDNKRTTKWEFGNYGTLSANHNINPSGDVLEGGMLAYAGSNEKIRIMKANPNYLSIKGNGVLGIPLDAATSSVELSIRLSSSSDNRTITIGDKDRTGAAINTNYVTITHKMDVDTDKTYKEDFDTNYITVKDGKKWLLLRSGDGNVESKIALISITETKPASGGEGGGGGQTNPVDPPNPPTPVEPEELGTTDGLDPGSVGDRTWTFPMKEADRNVSYNGTEGTYRGLEIDATTGQFRFEANPSKMHVNLTNGAIIKVPVDGKCEITVTASAGAQYALYTINGTQASTTNVVTTVPYDGAAGYVNIKSTGNAYIKSIAIRHIAGGGDVVDPDDQPDADNFYNGFKAKSAVEGRSYTLNFTNIAESLGTDSYGSDGKTLNNSITKGIFTYAAGSKQAQYHSETYGVEFKTTNKLTFSVAGNSYIVVGGDDNSNADLTASSTTGTVSPETLNSNAASHADLAACKTKGNNTLVYEYKGSAGQVTLTVGTEHGKDTAGKAYIAYVCVIPKKTVTLDTTKPDVWDFGAMEVTGANNLLTVATINGLYPEDTTAGANNISIGAFAAKDSNGLDAVKFVPMKDNARIRTTNTSITRYDAKSLVGEDGITYAGYLYSNNTSTEDTVAASLANATEGNVADHLDIYLYEGDTLTCMLGSNSNAAEYKLYNSDNQEYASFDYTNEKKLNDENKTSVKLEKAVFHAGEEGWYKLYCIDEKLVCARITREHAPMVTVSGSIDVTQATNIPAGYGVIYTNVTTGKKTEMTVTNGTYTGVVPGGYSYKVSLKDANGYVVDGGRTCAVGTDNKTNNLTIKTVDQKTISGSVTGLTDAELAKVKFVFEIPEEYVFEPVIKLNKDSEGVLDKTYTLKVESGVTYKVKALDVNDSILKTTEVSATTDTPGKNIEFEKKPTYAVTLKITGVENVSNAKATFTNVDEKYTDGKTPYTYTFENLSAIQLRDGRYSVKVAGLGNYAVTQNINATPNVNVDKAAVSNAPVPFVKLSAWDFAKLNDTTDVETIDGVKYYAGLVLTDSEPDKDDKISSVAENKTYLLGKSGTKVTVPGLKEGDRVTITYCYTAAFTLNDAGTADGADKVYGTGSGSTSIFESMVHTMKADKDLVISNTTGKFKYIEDGEEKERDVNETYLCSIDVLAKADQVPYAPTIKVGKDKTYKTINEALEAVKKMVRSDTQKVTIEIDPGDYEEMLVIDTPNVTLKNASATPSIELKNKGVDIDDNAVRVTWYYGHGYTYYSMGSDCKYNAELLATNKLNGYASFKNPGSGKNNGSYWNASVVINADNVSAEGIIFENSFNQYMSTKAAADVIEKQSGAKELAGKPRANMEAGDPTVQNKAYVERAAALAIINGRKNIYFENCKIISRQDTLFGDTDVVAAFYDCDIYGSTDYIMGPMTAVFAKCNLVFNTSEDKNDVGYITAPQQANKNVRGYLMWNCTVTSTTPGVDTASEYTSKAGAFGRPWTTDGEAIFYETIIDATCAQYYKASASMIQPVGWNDTLGGKSARSQEYNTHEWAMDVTTGNQLNNNAKRASWSKVLTADEAKAITVAAFLGDWDAFKGKNMTPVVPTEMGTKNNMPVGSVDASKMTLQNLGADADGKGQVEITWTALHKSEADKYVITVTNKDVATEQAKTITVDNATNDGEDVLAGKVTLKETVTGLTVDNTYEVSIGTERGTGANKETGTPAVKTIKVAAEAEEPDDGSLKDPVNGTKFELPITLDGLSKDKKYPGGFSVTGDFNPYSDKKGVTSGDPITVAGVEYPLWLKADSNPKTSNKNSAGKVPDTGAVLVLDALANGVVTVICHSGTNKEIFCVDGTTDTYQGGDFWEENKVYKFEVKKDHKYYIYANGSKIELCKAYVVYEGKVTDPNFPDETGTGDGDDDGTGDGNDSSFDGWDRVARPVINRVEYSTHEGNDKVAVTVTANVGDEGGQKLVVDWKKDGATTSQTKTSTDKQKTHKFEFTCEGPGKYVVTATLKRKGLPDKVTTKNVTIKANGKVELTGGREGVHVELLDKGKYTYTGSAIKPTIAVYNGDELLTEGVDYTVKYSNNVKAASKNDGKKAPTITITGKGKLTGKTTQTFTIEKKNLKEGLYDPDKGVVVGGLSKEAENTLVVAENVKISPILVYKGVVLKAKKDFKLTTTGLTGDKAPAAGTAGKKITIEGMNNYEGTVELTLDVKKKSDLKKITAVQINKKVQYTYNGEKHKVEISAVKAGKDTVDALNYIVVYNGDQTSAGTQKFTVIGMGLYTGSKTASFKINPKKSNKLTHEVDSSLKENGNGTVTLSYKSTGVTFNDAITVTDPDLGTLVLGKDYKVSYSNNKKVTTAAKPAKYTITFLGNYKGSAAIKNQTFTINPVDLKNDLERTDYPDERYGELLYIKSADKAYGKKAAIIKSAPYVLVNGVALKSSDYTVKYYLSNGKEMKGSDKVELSAGQTTTITVKITGKNNYKGEVETTYDVINADKTDISKVKVTPMANGKKQSSVPYSGSAVYPEQIEIKNGKNPAVILKPDANGDWNTNPDYEVTFVNNIEKGKATIIVTGINNNVGSKTATYNVASRNLQKDVTATSFWEDFSKLLSIPGRAFVQ